MYFLIYWSGPFMRHLLVLIELALLQAAIGSKSILKRALRPYEYLASTDLRVIVLYLYQEKVVNCR